MSKERDKQAKEDDVMNTMAIRKIDKTNLAGLTLDKKKLLKSLQGIATSPIDFNKIRDNEKYGEDILVDTGILLAYLNDYDAWSSVVKDLFNSHILQEDSDKTLFLYINPCVLNEIMHLTSNNQSIIAYLRKHKGESLTKDEIENDILVPLEAAKETYLRQMNTYNELGSADSFNASLANDYGISFLTVDNKLVKNIQANIFNFPNIDKVYYAPPEKQSY